MDAKRFSETSAEFQRTTQHDIPEDITPRNDHYEHLKS
jgi:hypothetical protein